MNKFSGPINSGLDDPLSIITDQILNEYLNDHHLIYDNDAERRRQHFSATDRALRDWKSSKQCIFTGCAKKSIRRSHTIQKSGSLKAVSKNSVTLTPQFNPEIGKIVLTPRGLVQASVFPGFCEEHELLFEKFENEKSLESDDAKLLQIYRSLCREVIRLEYELRTHQRNIESYVSFRDNKFAKLTQERLSAAFLVPNDLKIQKLSFEPDPVVENIKKKIKDVSDVLTEIKEEFLREIELEVLGVKNTESESTIAISVDVRVPVALSGIGSFYIQEEAGLRRIFAVLGIYPHPNDELTEILIHGKFSDGEHIKNYVGGFNNPLEILNMLEQFMIRGTDHWFLSPDVWSAKSLQEQREILDEILVLDKGILHPLEFSIFDEIRREMLDSLRPFDNHENDVVEFLNKEEAKLKRRSDS